MLGVREREKGKDTSEPTSSWKRSKDHIARDVWQTVFSGGKVGEEEIYSGSEKAMYYS